ncbi:hypothetical protein [Bacillus sp. mrc49]|uniref:hypothetical protein n=1 Tax=Bacillus sp. mrc49 TaxID=2054913 RepID=UPI000C2791F6|nr:hypothetical protein [Bacillus sp. mrc49]PJN87916.1 hypothetical protein CVN76_23440 [Bacillus sp. mrc49]
MSKPIAFILLWMSQAGAFLIKNRIYFIQSFLVLFLMYLLLNKKEINELKITLIIITALSFLKSAHRK